MGEELLGGPGGVGPDEDGGAVAVGVGICERRVAHGDVVGGGIAAGVAAT